MRWGWCLRLGAVLLVVAGLVPADAAMAGPSDVTVTGRLATVDGEPVAGRPVVVTREATIGDVASDMLGYFASLGFAGLGCVTGDPSLEVCRENDYWTETGEDGRFRIELAGEDVRSVFGSPRDLSVVTGLPPESGETDGATVSWRVEPDESSIELPSVPLWSAGLRAKLDGSVATYTWRPAPSVPGATETSTSLGLTDSKRGLSVGLSDAGSPARVSTRLLEDAAPSAALSRSADVDGVPVTWTSGTIATKAAGTRPLSRGQPCLAKVGDRPESSHQDCWLVDGDFSAPLADVNPAGEGPKLGGWLPVDCGKRRDRWGHVECVRAPVSSVTVDLGKRMPIGEVVVRSNLALAWSTAEVEASPDQKSWRPVGRFTSSDVVREDVRLRERRYVVQAPDDTTARYLRIRATDPPGEQDTFTVLPDNVEHDADARVKMFRGDLAALTEVSVWKPQPRSARASSDPTRDDAAGPDSSRTNGVDGTARIGVGPFVIAGLVGAGLVGAGLLMWGTRLRRHR